MMIPFAAGVLGFSMLAMGTDGSSGLEPIEIVNGEFDPGTDGLPDGWTFDEGGARGSRSEAAPVPPRDVEWTDGTVLELPADGGRTIVSQSLPALATSQPGILNLGFNARGVGERASAVECLLQDDDGATIARASVPVAGEDWGRRSVDLRVPVGGSSEVKRLVLRNSESIEGGGVHIDRLSLARLVPDGPGFRPLFNGVDLDGWTGSRQGFGVEDGAIRTYPKRAGGNLFTAEEFDDFAFRFEFKLEPGANNGIALRSPLEGDPAYDGLEVQVLDTGDPRYQSILPWQTHGSIYGIAPARRGYLRPAGEWNREEILVEGRRIVVTLNGKKILDVDLDEAVRDGTASGRAHPGMSRRNGRIGFCGHGDVVWFRDLRVRPISGTSSPPSR